MKSILNHASSIISALLLLSTTMRLHAATTNYVALHSGGIYDGTCWATAFTNVQEAVTAGGANGVVLIAGGVYALPAALAINQTNILLRGGYEGVGVGPGSHDPAQWPTTLRRGGATHRIVLISGGHDTRLEHVSITGGNVNEGAGVRVEGSSQRVTLTGCTISNNGCSEYSFTALYGGGIFTAAGTSVALDGCEIRDNTISQSRSTGANSRGGGIYASGSLTVRDTVIAENSLMHSDTVKTQGAALYFNGGTLELFNVLVKGNKASWLDGGGSVYVGAGSASIGNCTIADNSTVGVVQTGAAVVAMTNSIIWFNHRDVTGTVVAGFSNLEDTAPSGGNISADPLFEAGYYIASTSPSFGTGSGAASVLDLEGYAKNSQGDAYAPADTVNMGFNYTAGFNWQYPDVYVSPAGDDALNDGKSATQPFRSITKALEVAHDSTRIHIAAGTYASGVETFPLVLKNKPGVVIEGVDQSSTVIDATGSDNRVFSIDGSHRTYIGGLSLTGGSAVQGSGLRFVNSRHAMAENCSFSGNSFTTGDRSIAPQGGGVYVDAHTWLTLVGCTIRDNLLNKTSSLDDATRGGGVYSLGKLTLKDTVVAYNTINNPDQLKTHGAGIYSSDAYLEMFNVLVAGNVATSPDGAGAVRIDSGNATLGNCTVADNGTVGIKQSGTAVVTMTNSIVCFNRLDVVGTVDAGFSNIGADPFFEYGYYLAASSPCLGTGSATASSLGLASYARNSAGDTYSPSDVVNIGFHYPTGFDLQYPDIYVSPTGDDTFNDGKSPALPFRSVTKALDSAHDGTRIHVAGGDYTKATETYPLTVSGKLGVSIAGENAASTRIDATGSGRRVLSGLRAHRLDLSGLTLTGGSGETGSGLRIENSQCVSVENCVVSNNAFSTSDRYAIPSGGGLYADAGTSVSLVGCLIRDNRIHQASGMWNASTAQGGGIYSAGKLDLRNVIVASNKLTHAKSNQTQGSGIYFVGATMDLFNVLVADNVVVSPDLAGAVRIASGSATLTNCTIAANENAGLYRIGGTLDVVNSILWGNGFDSTGVVSIAYSCVSNSTGYVDGGHNVTEATLPFPLFVDAAQGDYRLADGSPCVNAGLNQPWMAGATDLSGLRRVMAGRVDMGAYEWAPPAATLILVK